MNYGMDANGRVGCLGLLWEMIVAAVWVILHPREAWRDEDWE